MVLQRFLVTGMTLVMTETAYSSTATQSAEAKLGTVRERHGLAMHSPP